MKALRFWAVVAGVLGIATCTMDFDEFTHEGEPAAGGAGGSAGGAGGAAGTAGAGAQGVGGATVSCAEQYDHDNIQELCTESSSQCLFRVTTANGQSCEDICQDGGGECLQYANDHPNGSCNAGTIASCSQVGDSSAICVCSHGCGDGPPCQPADTCDSGTCQ